jgi:hypothetical protein
MHVKGERAIEVQAQWRTVQSLVLNISQARLETHGKSPPINISILMAEREQKAFCSAKPERAFRNSFAYHKARLRSYASHREFEKLNINLAEWKTMRRRQKVFPFRLHFVMINKHGERKLWFFWLCGPRRAEEIYRRRASSKTISPPRLPLSICLWGFSFVSF